MAIHEAYQRFLLQLYEIYDDREAANIADMVIEHVTGQRRIDRIMYKDLPLTEIQQAQLESISEKLFSHMPVQYALGEAWFADMKFYVNENVLIPRPETEELVEWMVVSEKKKVSGCSLLDIGTGSGCIPISIKRKMPGLNVAAIDVSEHALKVAAQNANQLESDISLLQLDFLDESNWSILGMYDIIVSNPPYVKLSESGQMASNVLHFEPHVALFVPDDDALLFYKKIAAFAKTHLKKDGCIFLEINEQLGQEVVALYKQNGYAVELKKDMQGKDRMVKATL